MSDEGSDDWDIRVLRAGAAVRLRPAMYIGGVDQEALQRLVHRLVRTTIDLHMRGDITELRFELIPDAIGSPVEPDAAATTPPRSAWIVIRDDGSGLPAEPLPPYHLSTLDIIFMDAHGGNVRFGDLPIPDGLGWYAHPIVNGLSSRLEIETTYNGTRWARSYERGEPVELHRLGRSAVPGTMLRFRPDPEIFGTSEVDPVAIRAWLQDLAWLYPQLRVHFQDERLPGRGGLVGRAREIAAAHGPVRAAYQCYRRDAEVLVDVGLAWSSNEAPIVHSFAAGRRTLGGTHVNGLWDGLAEYAAERGRKAWTPDIVRERLGPGLVALVHVDGDVKYTNEKHEEVVSDQLRDAVRDTVHVSLSRGHDAWRVRRFIDQRLGRSR